MRSFHQSKHNIKLPTLMLILQRKCLVLFNGNPILKIFLFKVIHHHLYPPLDLLRTLSALDPQLIIII